MSNEFNDILWIDQQVLKLEKQIASLKEVKEMYLRDTGTMALSNGQPPKRPEILANNGLNGSQNSSTLKEKVFQSIRAGGKFKASDSITDDLKSSYPTKDRSTLRADISKILSDGKKAERLVAYAKGRTRREGFLWGFPEWMDGTHVKKEHLP